MEQLLHSERSLRSTPRVQGGRVRASELVQASDAVLTTSSFGQPSAAGPSQRRMARRLLREAHLCVCSRPLLRLCRRPGSRARARDCRSGAGSLGEAHACSSGHDVRAGAPGTACQGLVGRAAGRAARHQVLHGRAQGHCRSVASCFLLRFAPRVCTSLSLLCSLSRSLSALFGLLTIRPDCRMWTTT